MKTCLPILLLVLLTELKTEAQVPPPKTVTIDSISITKSYYERSDSLIEKKLIELAMKSPAYNASNHQIIINELDLKKAKTAWLNLLTISTNYNDQSFKEANPAAPVVYPKYYFGLTIPLGIIFSQGSNVKTAREGIALRKEQQEELRRSIKADILGKYNEYKLYNSLIQIESELINDVLAQATQAEEAFKKGTVTVEVFINSIKTKNEELAKNMNLKYQQDIVKLEIERVIGMPLEKAISEALNPAP